MIELQGELITLATHLDRARLTSSEDRWTDNLTHYVGPGIAFKPVDDKMGRIYIRLDNTSDEAQAGRDVVRIDDFDPSHHAIHIGATSCTGSTSRPPICASSGSTSAATTAVGWWSRVSGGSYSRTAWASHSGSWPASGPAPRT